jgi:hypothetical protein
LILAADQLYALQLEGEGIHTEIFPLSSGEVMIQVALSTPDPYTTGVSAE